ncbi:phosphoribosylformylglycinamidine cyclo-ligase [Companilactobacillus mishanensis]|uniref:Phosphoribosylformylglycinamidine cyclo-ligase n=1 Tax=Companilactobacillus mishanensis TaxID=2486008 RepID=A0A5P0ZEN4_9LACO|nr:phosphoribosylformylglycinamidine cyclo-ligase [Companilactobacillus mishanensis]MQS51500.1 phosphoribosylformylglycinamidine cyclo-ligase [Companilactobacillus mishanensis]
MTNPYEKAGVNVNSGYEVSKFVKQSLSKKGSSNTNIGNFGGAFEIPEGYKKPVIISSNDGVGTKLLLAVQGDKHDTVGIDCVAMCVNDILAQGAVPAYFLDYIAIGNVDDKVKEIIKGVLEGCQQGQLDLVGGETAEMPDMYPNGTYDVAGFAAGIAEKDQLMSPLNVKDGDKLIGIASSGLHSNGFSLIRKIFFKDNDFNYDSKLEEFPDDKLGDLLLTPTRIYTKEILPLLETKLIHGIAHITGGGFFENIPRMLPDNLAAKIVPSYWNVPKLFKVVQKYGNLTDSEMFGIFNMGVGMVVAVDPKEEERILRILNQDMPGQGFTIGEVVSKKDKSVELIGGIR